MTANFGGSVPFICFILLLMMLSVFSFRFLFLAEKFLVSRGYQPNTSIIGRLVGAFMSSYLITGIFILFRGKGLEGTWFYFLNLSITFVMIFIMMGLPFFKLPKDYGIKPNLQPIIASIIGFTLIQIIVYYN